MPESPSEHWLVDVSITQQLNEDWSAKVRGVWWNWNAEYFESGPNNGAKPNGRVTLYQFASREVDTPWLAVFGSYSESFSDSTFEILRNGKRHFLRSSAVEAGLGLLTVTGVFLSLAGVSYHQWKTNALKPVLAGMTAPTNEFDYNHPPVTPDQAVATVQAKYPDWRFDWLVWPLTDYSTPGHYAIWMAGPPGPKEHLYETAYVDAVSGELTNVVSFPWYMQAMLVSEPLHFGDYGGIPLKTFWVTSAWLTLFITGNGAWLWWDRRRRAKGTVQ